MSHAKLADLLKRAAQKAETGDDLEVECPYCHNSFNVDQRPSPETSETGQDDEDNEGETADTNVYDNRRITRLNSLTKNLVAASTEGAKR